MVLAIRRANVVPRRELRALLEGFSDLETFAGCFPGTRWVAPLQWFQPIYVNGAIDAWDGSFMQRVAAPSNPGNVRNSRSAELSKYEVPLVSVI